MTATPERGARVSGGTGEFFRFFGGSAVGLLIDVGGYAALSGAGVSPGVANLMSAFASISVVYALVTRYTFRVGATSSTYLVFVAWYGTSIVVFSAVIEAAAVLTGWPPLVCKAATIPISFALNYWFSRRLLSRTRVRVA